MSPTNENPLVPIVLEVLRTAQQSLAIHELLLAIKHKGQIPVLDEDEQLALFKLNWLMMNALYQLQMEVWQDGYDVLISTLKIQLQPLPSSQAALSRALKADPLRDYYLNWQYFSETSKEDVQALLDGMWKDYRSTDEKVKARQILGVDASANAHEIRMAYRQQVNIFHPDKGGDATRFMEVRQAYEVLRHDL